MADIVTIKELRDETGLSLGLVSEALDRAGGDKGKAKDILQSQAGQIASEMGNREAKEGLVASYVHTNGKVGSLISLACETDFVARNDDFKTLARDLAMHAAAMRPADEADMLSQSFVKNPSMTVQDVINQSIQKLGENIRLRAFSVQAIG